jgi:uncharacterized protein with HEPN domain
MTQHDPGVPLRHMLDFAERAFRFGADKSADDITSDELLSMALPHALELIGEAANRLSAEEQAQFSGLPWTQMIAMRNRLAHGYDTVDYGRVVETVQHDLPRLIAALRAALEELEQQSPG